MTETIIDLLNNDGIYPVKVAKISGGEYASPCPGCGGRDRFISWPNTGRWWCRQCGLFGDEIEYLKQFHDMTFKEASDHLGVYKKMTSRTHRKKKKKKQNIHSQQKWTPNESKDIPDIWKQKATAFVDWSHNNLIQNDEQLCWLQERRCLNMDTIMKSKLGWNPTDLYRSKNNWGCSDREKDIFIPHGLVIPVFVNGEFNRVKTRADDRDPKYLPIGGGGISPMVLKSEIDTQCVIIVESELDAILLNQESGDFVTVIAMGSASYKPDRTTHDILLQAKLILQSFDTGVDDPAVKIAWSWWKTTYRQWKRWPCVKGKDPTELYLNGVSIRTWVKAGLYTFFPESAFGFFDFQHKYENPFPTNILNEYDEAVIERMAIMEEGKS